MMWFILLPAFALGGLGRRVAGGVMGQWFNWDTGALISRNFYGLTLALAALAGGVVWWQAAIIVPCTYIGCTVPNKFTFPDSWGIAPIGGIGLGRQPGGNFWRDAAGLLVHGLAGTGLAAIGAWWLGFILWPLLVASGASIVGAYLIGWAVTGQLGRYDFPLGFRDGAEVGEFLWGGTVAAAFFVTAMAGA